MVEVVSALDLVMTVMQKFLDTTLTADTNEMTLLEYIETHTHECLLKENQIPKPWLLHISFNICTSFSLFCQTQ